MYKEYLDPIEIFKTKPKEFIAFLGPKLHRHKIEQGEFLYYKDDMADESKNDFCFKFWLFLVYFILRGCLAGVLEEFDNKDFITIQEGFYIGELELVNSKLKRDFSVQAKADSELLILRRSDWKILNSTFKKEMEEFKDKAEMRQANL